jgi:hypothetical protein
VIITDRELIKSKKMTNPMLDEQLKAHRQTDKEVPIKARLNIKEKKVEALLVALDRYEGVITIVRMQVDGTHEMINT